MEQSQTYTLNISLPAQLFTRPRGQTTDWQELEPAPGFFDLPADVELNVRVHAFYDRDLTLLIRELTGCPLLTELNLSENRNITDAGLAHLKALPGITRLNMSSVSVTNTGLEFIKGLPRLTYLDLSYCNKLTDLAVKPLKGLRELTYLNLQGCVKITNGGLAKLRRRGLEIKK